MNKYTAGTMHTHHNRRRSDKRNGHWYDWLFALAFLIVCLLCIGSLPMVYLLLR